MTSAAKRKSTGPLSKELVEGFPNPGTFEDIPRVRQLAGPSVGQRMKGKVAIVTGTYPPPSHRLLRPAANRVQGANSALGIGRATVHQFAQNGARAIFLCDYNDDNFATHERELRALYPDVKVHTRQFDASDEAEVEKVVKEAVDTYGRLDVFFANAGIATGAIFTETTSEDFMRVMRVNTLRCAPSLTKKRPTG
jgi:NAD(P)-dependent dehydrogenase (short-subunit alcohol dehydrogenase family)